LDDGADPGAALGPRVEASLHAAIDRVTRPSAPPKLREALAYAVFPGGSRLRPRLCLAVASAHGDGWPRRSDAAAAAAEFVHCASLVHGDLPSFDDAGRRRGRPSAHGAFGEPIALLVGDALLVLAFDVLARAGASEEAVILSAATGAVSGVIAGRAWEAEPGVTLDDCHRAKTASLFGASAAMGAIAAGADPAPWHYFGETVGLAHQAADDVADALDDEAPRNKSRAGDAHLGRPNVARAHGVEIARRRVSALVAAARAAIPPHADGHLRPWLDQLEARLGNA